MIPSPPSSCFFFFNDTATTEIYTLSLHDALPIFVQQSRMRDGSRKVTHITEVQGMEGDKVTDRKSTRLNSSHSQISYAVFCLKKKKKNGEIADRRSLSVISLDNKNVVPSVDCASH